MGTYPPTVGPCLHAARLRVIPVAVNAWLLVVKGDAGRDESAIPSSPPTICLPLESHSLVQISGCVHRCVPANFYYHVVLYLGSQEPRLWTCRTLLFLPCLTFSPGRPRVGPGPNSRSTPGQLQQLFILREVSVIRKQFPVDPEGSTISSSNRPVQSEVGGGSRRRPGHLAPSIISFWSRNPTHTSDLLALRLPSSYIVQTNPAR